MTLHPTAYCPKCKRGRVIKEAKSNGEHTYYNLDYKRQVIDIVPPGRMLYVWFTCGHTGPIVTSRPETLALAPDGRGGYRPRGEA
jgi:hypothetical protein